jgi:MFS family permease
MSNGPSFAKENRSALLLITVAALGYFVDIYDLILFNVVKKESLISLGYTSETDLKNYGLQLFNWQMGGMLVGGILWGILGDKKGRLSVLFGSILTYSLANIGCGFVKDTCQRVALCSRLPVPDQGPLEPWLSFRPPQKLAPRREVHCVF